MGRARAFGKVVRLHGVRVAGRNVSDLSQGRDSHSLDPPQDFFIGKSLLPVLRATRWVQLPNYVEEAPTEFAEAMLETHRQGHSWKGPEKGKSGEWRYTRSDGLDRALDQWRTGLAAQRRRRSRINASMPDNMSADGSGIWLTSNPLIREVLLVVTSRRHNR